MDQILDKIEQANPRELEILLETVLERYEILYPEWDVCIISLQRQTDRNAQIDRMIHTLEKLKKHTEP